MIDALHHAAYQGRTKRWNPPANCWSAPASWRTQISAAMQAILKSCPSDGVFSGVDLAPDVAGAGNDFEALEKLRRLAFADQVEEPQQLSLWQANENMSLPCDREWKLKYTPDDGDLVACLLFPPLMRHPLRPPYRLLPRPRPGPRCAWHRGVDPERRTNAHAGRLHPRSTRS